VATPRIVSLALLLLCLGACRPDDPPVPPQRSAASTRGVRAVATAWTADDAITSLRRRLTTRGFAREVTAGPMVALWVEDAPPSRLGGEPAIPALARRSEPGAWLILTEAGGWWVWQADDLGPVPLPGALLD
jgi:hypothetical protein